MRKTAITILSTALLVAGSAATVNAASGADREPVATPASAKPEKIEQRRAMAQASVRCHSLGCINKKLSSLYRDAYKCERIVDLTRYSGYLYTPDGGSSGTITTALDYTGPGNTPSDSFVIYTC